MKTIFDVENKENKHIKLEYNENYEVNGFYPSWITYEKLPEKYVIISVDEWRNYFLNTYKGLFYPAYVNKNLKKIIPKNTLPGFYIGNKTGKKYVCQNKEKSRKYIQCKFDDKLVFIGEKIGWVVKSQMNTAQKSIYLARKAMKKFTGDNINYE